jgi:hypothetical protein
MENQDMRTTCFFILACVITLRGFCQDTLYTKNGETVAGKVMEITDEEVKYKRPSNPDGPLYVMKKSELVLIIYKNGSKDVFKNTSGNSNEDNGAIANSSDGNDFNTYIVRPSPQVNVWLGPPRFFGFVPWVWSGWNYGYYSSGRPYRHHRYYAHHGHYGRRH